MTSRPHFLEIELIHLVDKTKNVWLIFRQSTFSGILAKAINILSTNPFPLCFSFVLFYAITDFKLDLNDIFSTEYLDDLIFFPINLGPSDIRTLFHKSKIDDSDTFKFILFAFGKSKFHHLLPNFLFIKYWRNPGIILKQILQTQWIIHSMSEKKHLSYYFDMTQSKYLHLDGSLTRWNPWNMSTYYEPFPYFYSFRKLLQSRKLLKRSSSFRNLPQSQKLLERSSKSSPLMQQLRPHSQLEPNHPLLHWNVKAPLQITKFLNYPENHLRYLSCHFHFPHQRPMQPLNKNICICFVCFSHYIAELLGIIPQRSRDMITRITF